MSAAGNANSANASGRVPGAQGRDGLWAPWRRVHALRDLDPAELEALGVRLVLLDRDNTCVPRGETDPTDEVVAWCAEARGVGLALALVSNNWDREGLERTSSQLECPVVSFAMKPLPHGLRRAMAEAGVPREQTILVGDQLFTDVLAGRLAGVRVALVDPQSERDLFYAKPMRKVERRLLRGVPYEGEGETGDGAGSAPSAPRASEPGEGDLPEP